MRGDSGLAGGAHVDDGVGADGAEGAGGAVDFEGGVFGDAEAAGCAGGEHGGPESAEAVALGEVLIDDGGCFFAGERGEVAHA